MIHETTSFSHKFDLNPEGKDKSLSIMYWTSKMHKEAIGASYIAASKIAVQISKAASNGFKLSIKYKVSMVNRVFIFHLNNFGLQKIPSPFLKKLKRFIIRLMQLSYFEI